jgi:hypothetical protein
VRPANADKSGALSDTQSDSTKEARMGRIVKEIKLDPRKQHLDIEGLRRREFTEF